MYFILFFPLTHWESFLVDTAVRIDPGCVDREFLLTCTCADVLISSKLFTRPHFVAVSQVLAHLTVKALIGWLF